MIAHSGQWRDGAELPAALTPSISRPCLTKDHRTWQSEAPALWKQPVDSVRASLRIECFWTALLQSCFEMFRGVFDVSLGDVWYIHWWHHAVDIWVIVYRMKLNAMQWSRMQTRCGQSMLKLVSAGARSYSHLHVHLHVCMCQCTCKYDVRACMRMEPSPSVCVYSLHACIYLTYTLIDLHMICIWWFWTICSFENN